MSMRENSWTGFRVADERDPASRRHVQDIAVLEIANVARFLLEHGGASTVPGIVRDVARLVGMQRVRSDADSRVKEAIEYLVGKGLVTVQGDSVQLITA